LHNLGSFGIVHTSAGQTKQENIMANRQPHQWAVYNLAIIGSNPEIFDSKEEALKFVKEYSEYSYDPFIEIDEENKRINYRGSVYL
jgi:hypothetical protein